MTLCPRSPFRRLLPWILFGPCLLLGALCLNVGAAHAQTDSDGDTVLDSIECVLPLVDTDGDGTPNCYDNDDDGDGILSEGGGDADGDGLLNNVDTDDDGDGTPTADEGNADDDYDGRSNYLDSDDEDGPRGDHDGDGLSNEDEEDLGSDPESADSDGDTVPDGDEVGENGSLVDTDGDGDLDIVDNDDDGDGIPTSVEHDSGVYGGGQGNPPGGGDWNDVDADGIPNYLDTDSDGDGRSDHDEAFGTNSAGVTLADSAIRQVVDRLIVARPQDRGAAVALDVSRQGRRRHRQLARHQRRRRADGRRGRRRPDQSSRRRIGVRIRSFPTPTTTGGYDGASTQTSTATESRTC